MFRVPLIVAFVLAIAFGGGIWITRVALDATVGFGAIRLGAWAAFPDAQTNKAGPYAKTHRAENGQLLLGSSEGLAFYARTDDAGRNLDPSCTYVISGLTPPARFWSLFAADATGLAMNAGEGLPSSLNSWTVLRAADGTFTITVGARAAPGNWLALRSRQSFTLVFTLFDTPTAGSSGLVDLSMPKLEKTGCGDA